VSVGVLWIPVTTYGAGFATPGIGIKARSMGGSFRGLADDWSAVSYNPAGLAFLETSELDLSLGIYSPQLTYNPDVRSGDHDIGFSQANGLDHYPLYDIWPQPSLAGIAVNPEWEGFVFGGAIYWPHDVNYAWDLFRQPLTYDTDYQFAEQNFRTDLDVLDIHPTAAKRLGNNTSVGLGLSFTNADIVFRRILFLDNELGEPFDIYPFNQFIGDFRLEGNGFSVGANAGLLWEVSEKVTIGISGQTPIGVTIDGFAELDMAWPQNQPLTVVNDGIAVVDGDSIRTQLFYSGINDALVREANPPHSAAKYEFDLNLPAQIGAGIGWKPTNRLTLAFDAVMTFWSSVDEWKIQLKDGGLNAGTKQLTEVVIPFGWDDQLRISGGLQYLATEKLTLRGGTYYDGAAAADQTFSPNFPNDGDVIGLTGGFAYSIEGHVELAAAQEAAFCSKRTIVVPDGGVAGSTVYPGEYSLSRFETIFSISYRF
jgi:long-chain fatty acid transport protein